jgi:broad specificity phosphatase PhoE
MSRRLTIALARLCECEGNKKQLVAAHGDLTQLGKDQAAVLGARLRSLGVQHFFSSGSSACLQTATVARGECPLDIFDEFSEPPYPDWKGKDFKFIEDHWPVEWQKYQNPQPGDADAAFVPGGESFRASYERAKRGIDRIYETWPNLHSVAVVTHGEIARWLILGLLGARLEQLFRLRWYNGAVSIFQYDGVNATFECINDHSHLVVLGLGTKDFLG